MKGGENMYRHVIAAIIFMFAFVGMPSLVNAQQGVQDGTYNQAPNNQNTAPGGTTTNQNQDDGFNWWWLLPLLAIPFLLMLRRGNKEEDRSHDRDPRFADRKS